MSEGTNEPTIDRLIFFGRKFNAQEKDALMRANLSMTMDLVSEYSMTLHDPDFNHLRKGIFKVGIPVAFDELRLEVASVNITPESGQPVLDVRCRPRIIRKLKKRRGPRVMRDASPSDFIEAECRAVGAKFVTQPSPKRFQVARDTKKEKGELEPPSSWTTFKRLAEELGYVIFEASDTIYFAQPTWLMDKFKDNALKVEWDKEGSEFRPMTIPNCSKNVDSEEAEVTVSFTMEKKYGQKFRPGKVIDLSGIPTFNGKYLVMSVEMNLLNDHVVDITAGTPIDPEKPPKPSSGGGGGSSAGGGTSTSTSSAGGPKSANAFVTYALRQAGDTYIFGAEASKLDANPGAFDCSELIEWAAAQAGVYIPDGSSAQIAFCRPISVEQAINTRGALLWHPGHIAISLGGGRTIEAANPGFGVGSLNAFGRFQRGGLIPGMIY